MNTIVNGTGDPVSAKVGTDNRLQTRSVTETDIISSALDGDAYNINTGLITGISGSSSLIYFKNSDRLRRDFVLTNIAIGAFEGITYITSPYLTLIKNPTGGDIISDATDAEMIENRNFDKTIGIGDSLAYKGKNGGTITGGTNMAILQVSQTGRSFYSIDFIIGVDKSLGVYLNVDASSGSASMYCALIGYWRTAV